MYQRSTGLYRLHLYFGRQKKLKKKYCRSRKIIKKRARANG